MCLWTCSDHFIFFVSFIFHFYKMSVFSLISNYQGIILSYMCYAQKEKNAANIIKIRSHRIEQVKLLRQQDDIKWKCIYIWRIVMKVLKKHNNITEAKFRSSEQLSPWYDYFSLTSLEANKWKKIKLKKIRVHFINSVFK